MMQYNAVSTAQSSLTLSDYNIVNSISLDDIATAVESIRQDHAEFVWMKRNVSTTRTKNSDGSVSKIEVTFKYNELASNSQYYQRQFEAAAQSLLSEARKKRSLVDQERYIYDYLMTKVKYESNDLDQTAYAALVNRRSVCAGVGMAFNYLMRELGIPSYYSVGTSKSGGSHGWNIVKIDGAWYHVDATPNTSNSLTQYDYDNYFNIPYGSSFHAKENTERFPNNHF